MLGIRWRNCSILTFSLPWRISVITLTGTSSLKRSSSSNSRWKQRQGRDAFARDARVQGLKSRAAFKLLEVHFLDLPNQRET
jgi:hypothetical protein